MFCFLIILLFYKIQSFPKKRYFFILGLFLLISISSWPLIGSVLLIYFIKNIKGFEDLDIKISSSSISSITTGISSSFDEFRFSYKRLSKSLTSKTGSGELMFSKLMPCPSSINPD